MARTVKTTDAYVEGLDELLRDLRALPKHAQDELRDASKVIATTYMAPAWAAAAAAYAGPWGEKIAATVKAKRDRIPSVNIGSQRKAFSGGASPTMVRYASEAGYTRDSSGARAGVAAAFGPGRNWMQKARTYIGPAMLEWGRAVDRVCLKFNTNRDG